VREAAGAAVAAFTAITSVGVAQASVFDTYGFGARGAAMAGAQAAAAEDFSAVYYNPAALTVHKHPHVGTAVTILAPMATVDRAAGAPRRSDTPGVERPDPNVGITLGLLVPLGGKIENRFALAIGAYLPTIQVTRVDALDAGTPQFYRYESLPDKIMIAPALAYELHPSLSLGLGMQVLGSVNGTADVELDLLSQRFTRKNLKVDVDTTTGLTGGVLVRPTDTLRLGLSYRESLALDYHLRTDIAIQQVGKLVADIEGTSLFTPSQFTGAVAWQATETLLVTGDLVWARWSAAPDPAARFDVTLDGAPLGQGRVEAESEPVDLGAVDTVSPRLGLEWRPAEAWAVRGGYQLSPTPLPAQTERSNYIDSTAHQLAVGGGYSFPDPLEIHDSPLTIDVAVQWTHLQSREMTKRAPDDPMGDYTAAGELLAFSVTLRHDFK
jgi:long-chain fatty acid transport protein